MFNKFKIIFDVSYILISMGVVIMVIDILFTVHL